MRLKRDDRVTGARGKEVEGSRTLDDWAKGFGVPLRDEVREALLRFAELLLAWGARINLTAAKSMEMLVTEHLADGFAIAAHLATANGDLGAQTKVIDVGTGGGLPGIPVALLRPTCEVTLVEATGKKIAFLRTAVRELGLGARVRVEQRRVAEGDPGSGRFDVAISRAMLPPREWMSLGMMLVRPGGRVFCLASSQVATWPDGLELRWQEAYREDRWVAELERST